MQKVIVIIALAGGLVLASAVGSRAAETAGKGFPIRAAGGPPAVTEVTVAVTPPPAAAGAPSSQAPAAAVAAALPAAVTTQEFEARPLLFSDTRPRAPRSGGAYAMPSVWPAVLAVVVVCALFGGGLYFMKKYLPGHRQLFSHPAMEVLGRTHLDQKRYVSLLRVGKRILVVGVSADDMQPLSEIVEEDEITAIMEVARPKTEHGLTIFQKLFQRNVIEADAAETRARADAEAQQLHEDMERLRKRVRDTVRTREPAGAATAAAATTTAATAMHVDRVG